MHNQVRIIGGTWRSRVLRFAPLPGLRPTPDRVRETVFNWLGQDLTDRVTLELFAGSGAFSFEALSRGAARAVCVERNARALADLRGNAQRLGTQRLDLHRADVLDVGAPEDVRLRRAAEGRLEGARGLERAVREHPVIAERHAQAGDHVQARHQPQLERPDRPVPEQRDRDDQADERQWHSDQVHDLVRARFIDGQASEHIEQPVHSSSLITTSLSF